MGYDFTSLIDRRGMDALALDAVGMKHWGSEPEPPKDGFDFIPMWVADMNFATCPSVVEAMVKRAQHPLFGYFLPREEYFDAIIKWQTARNHVTGLQKEHIGYENGVHGCISSAIDVLSQPGDAILVHSPTYVGFFGDLEGKGRRSVLSPLKKDENGVWRMDYEDMDAKLKENHIRLAIFCSPHNPCGRVWERWEVERAMEVFEANRCTVISDEIWSDIVYPGHQHVPTQSVSEYARNHTVALYAPSKTFNLAGLVGAYHIIYDPVLRERIDAFAGRTHYNEMNVMSMYALLGAYQPEGYQWVDELCKVLEGNAKYACRYIEEFFPGVEVSMPQGTYMIFLDCTGWCERTGQSIDHVLHAGWDVGVGWQDGRGFKGPCHIRMNLALPRSRVREALDRLREHVFTA